MNASAAIADPLLRRASGQRVRPSDLHRTVEDWRSSSWRLSPAWERDRHRLRRQSQSPGLRALVSRRDSAISQRIVMNNAGLPSKIDEEPAILFAHLFRGHPWTC